MKVNSLKQEVSYLKSELVKKDDELLLVKGRNFEINQRLVKIVEEKDAPHIDYHKCLIRNFNPCILYSILAKEKTLYVNQLLHLKKMIRLYFMDLCMMDVEMEFFSFFSFLRKKICVGPCDQPSGIDEMRFSKNHGVLFTTKWLIK